MNRKRKLFWGVIFLVSAVTLVLGQLGYLGGLNFMTVLLGLAMVGFLVDGILSRSFGVILFSLAFIVIFFKGKLGLEQLTAPVILITALLATIGLNLLFPRKRLWQDNRMIETPADCENGAVIKMAVNFGDSIKYVTSRELELVEAECSFGNLKIDLKEATLKNHQAAICVSSSFGKTILLVPREWTVVQNARASVGGIDEKGVHNPDGVDTLYVEGEISFGTLEIRYV